MNYNDKGYRTYIENTYYGGVKIHIQMRRSEDSREYLTLEDGKIMSTIIEGCAAPVNGHFLELPEDVFESIKERIMYDVEQRGGAPTQQSLRGEIKRLEDEVKWLRSLVDSKSNDKIIMTHSDALDILKRQNHDNH